MYNTQMGTDKVNRLAQISKVATAALLLLAVAGCTGISKEKMEKLLEKDPSFRKILSEKETITSEVKALEKEFKEKKKATNSKISILRKEFQEEKERINSKIKQLKYKLDPERNLIKNQIALLKEDIKTNQIGLNDTEKTINDLQRLMSKEGALDISKEEVTRW